MTEQVEQKWVVRQCVATDCTVMIRSKISDPWPPLACRWHQAGTAYNTRYQGEVRPDDGPMMTKEEFGLDLYHAIVAKTKGDHVTLKQILDKNTIGAADLKRLLAIPC